MKKFTVQALLCCGLSIFWAAPAQSQTDWTTIGNDAQRSFWIRSDAKISPDTVKSPDFQLAWKHKFDNTPRQLSAITPPVLLDFLISHRGFRSLAFVGGSGGKVFSIDTDLARPEWERRVEPPPADGSGSIPCPGGMTAQLTRPTPAALPALSGISGPGRRSAGVSAVGKPNEGAAILAELASRTPPRRSAPVPSSGRTRAPARRALSGVFLVYALTSDGMLHNLYVSNGVDREPPIKFLPPNANATGLIIVDDVAYVATINGCGGVPDGIWALDLETKKVAHWKSPGNIAGIAALAIGPEGVIYAATGPGPNAPANASPAIVALKAGTLDQLGAYSVGGTGFVSSPVVIDHKEKDLLAVAAADGTIHLVDGAALGKGDQTAPLAKSPAYSGMRGFIPGALATWRDDAGVNWVLAPTGGPIASGVKFPTTNGEVTNGATVAWKIVDKNGAPALEPGWVSRDMTSPITPVVVNGVVFAASGGEFRPDNNSMAASERAFRSKPAVLYALDGATGKTLWDSGESIKSFATGGALSAGGSTVYLTTFDGALYAFGFPIEH